MATIEDIPHQWGMLGTLLFNVWPSNCKIDNNNITVVYWNLGKSEGLKVPLNTPALSERVLASALNIPYRRGTGLR